MNQVKTPTEIIAIRESGRMLAHVLRFLEPQVTEGITTLELNRLAASELDRLGGQPAFLGFEGFPGVICISVNDEIVHGIPGPRKLLSGDIVGLDFGVSYQGMITDGATTVPVGAVSPEATRLMTATREALDEALKVVRRGARIGDISQTVERRLRRDGLGVVEDMSGHGVGHQVHEDPLILNFGPAGRGMRLKEGMTIAIEPMATLGSHEVVMARDGWTICSADGSLGSQHEHTVLVLRDGCEVLTR